jgi:ATP-dependent Clp protease ATP-binding subunit ClpA
MESSEQLQAVFAGINDEIASRGDEGVRAEHILLVLLGAQGTSVARALDAVRIDRDRVRGRIDEVLPRQAPEPAKTCYPYLDSGSSALKTAMTHVATHGSMMSTSDVLLGVLDTDCDAAEILRAEAGDNLASLRSALVEDWSDQPAPGA